MFRHNLIITYRSFLRHKSSFLINLIGLSTGLACVLLIYLWVNDEMNVDKFHKEDARLYQVLEHVDQAGSFITRHTTAGPTAKALAEEMPEVERAVTTTYIAPYVLTIDDKNFTGKGIFASTDFFHLFSFDLIQGDKDQVLTDKNSVVLSESLAKRLFGDTEDVIGKSMEWHHRRSFQVSGIFKDVPEQSSMQFDFVLPFEEFWDRNEWVRTWYNTSPQTYVLLKPGADVEKLNEKIYDLIRDKTEGNASHRSPFVAQYSQRYLHGRYENGVLTGGRIDYVKLFSIVAAFILAIACINFMNLSTARASRRMKEIGIKKTIGASRRNLISQYLSEAIFMTFLSLGVAILLVAVLLPEFNLITEKNLSLSFTWEFFLVLMGGMIVTGLISGSYPALYLSAIKPINVLKGKMKNVSREAWARKGLVVFQFAISIILIVSITVIYKQIDYAQTKSLGYEKDNVLIFERSGPLNENEKFETFLNEVKNIPGVLKASNAGHDMTGHNGGTYGVQWPGKDPEDRTEFERFSVNYGLIELLGIEMKSGRTFSKDFGADTSKIIFNEAGIEFMGLEDPIGKIVTLWGREMEIIGVAKDFHFDSFHEEVKPLFFWLAPGADYAMVKIATDHTEETIAQIETLATEFNPGFPFSFRFIDQDYQELYAAEKRVSTLSRYFGGLAILISCLGLFGLATFSAQKRLKEISIRKILGSSIWNIIKLLSAEFTQIVIVAIFIALPISYFITNRWLEGFAYRIDLKWWYFAGSAFVALLIAFVTVSFQTFKVARVNPSEYLRDE
ncbi:MAG: ABC transporter permease [Bacteroidetes bacterium]|nr:ABC transporter permease [Bacteroidota bacterium]